MFAEDGVGTSVQVFLEMADVEDVDDGGSWGNAESAPALLDPGAAVSEQGDRVHPGMMEPEVLGQGADALGEEVVAVGDRRGVMLVPKDQAGSPGLVIDDRLGAKCGDGGALGCRGRVAVRVLGFRRGGRLEPRRASPCSR